VETQRSRDQIHRDLSHVRTEPRSGRATESDVIACPKQPEVIQCYR
jgi:hypothetical protein